jgi:hypothetical protein
MNNLPLDLRPPDYIGHQGFRDLIPYTPSDTAELA